MSIEKFIDHTYLKPDCTQQSVQTLCEEGMKYGFFSVCIPPFYVRKAKQLLEESDCKISTVIGYPYGYSSTAAKVEEIKRALDDGADELDAVINICAVKDENWNYIKNDIESMTRAVQMRGKVIKIIIESALLTREEIVKVSEFCLESGVDFVKTSTGLFEGADVSTVSLLKDVLKGEVKIKASGGIRNFEQAEAMINAGANRLGTSSGKQIISQTSAKTS